MTLQPITEEQAITIASWFKLDSEGQRRFGDFYGVHPRWWNLIGSDEGRHGFVATVAGSQIGFVDLEQRGEAMNSSIYVRVEERGRGFGVAVLEAGLQVARTFPGARRVEAEVEPDNAASLRCCDAVGFRRTGVDEHGDVVLEFELHPR